MRHGSAIACLLTATLASAQTPTALDPSDVIVDAAGSANPAVSSNAQGQYVLVWTEAGQIQAQRFAADGNSLGSVLTVGTGEAPTVSLADNGAFLVVWRVLASPRLVKKRFYNAADVPTAEENVDSDAQGLHLGGVAADASGNFVVTWAEYAGSGYDYDLRSRRYGSDGTALSGELVLTSDTASKDREPRIAYSAGAQEYIVVWDRETTGYDIRGLRLDDTGAASGASFAVNDFTTDTQVRADVARSREGSFVVTWDGPGVEDGDGVFARQFDAAGDPMGPQFVVNTYTSGSQQRPRVVMDASADFVVTWFSNGSPGNDADLTSVQARAFHADGTPLSAQFQVNTYTTGQQTDPDVAMLGGGEFVIAWEQNVFVMPLTFLDLRKRRYGSVLPLFADGFESGNTAAWSNSVP